MRIVYCPRCHQPVPINDAGQATRAGHVMTLAGLACHTPPTAPSAGAGTGVAR